ncbi:MAG: hypothetical protein LH628_00795 [Microcoleus sp. CAN_BIN18]|nr:hypothetical protein [Microcoleus sp. CAN_BIN18]
MRYFWFFLSFISSSQDWARNVDRSTLAIFSGSVFKRAIGRTPPTASEYRNRG